MLSSETVLLSYDTLLLSRETLLLSSETVLLSCETVLLSCETVLLSCEIVLLSRETVLLLRCILIRKHVSTERHVSAIPLVESRTLDAIRVVLPLKRSQRVAVYLFQRRNDPRPVFITSAEVGVRWLYLIAVSKLRYVLNDGALS